MSMLGYILIIYPKKVNKVVELERQNTVTSVSDRLKSKRRVGEIEWTEVVSTMNGYHQFALFLEKEFSTENLLFVTEYMQLKQEMMQIPQLRDKIIGELGLDYDLRLPLDIPKSIIAKEFGETYTGYTIDTNIDKAVFDGFSKIYIKYINSATACMEVNISSPTRVCLINIFKNVNINNSGVTQLLNAMETAVKEISYLMNDSQSRFRLCTVFTEIMQMTPNESK